MNFTEDELKYYSRQILVRNFGGQAQEKLHAAHIAVIGAGGIGAPLLLYLAGAGLGEITLYEDDEIVVSNLHRQIIYRHDQIGTDKSAQAIDALAALNPHMTIHAKGRFDGRSNPKVDLLIDGSDNLATRQLANQCAKHWQTPLLSASLAQWEGQIAYFDPARDKGCYHCLYPEGTDASAIPSCSEAGVIGATAGVIGTMAALEAIKILADIKPLEAGQMLMIDGLYRELRPMRINPRADCPVCGG